ncbi:MAG: SDR family NAD(P)-dependent oxidoreductase [Legionellaceae bacterium]|nr:SDR family NAD(P)-dependent oxidoreductase [Legionellaceae bacterium]
MKFLVLLNFWGKLYMSKVVIITGGTRGIGFAIAKAFLEKGDKVIINFRSNKEQADKALNELKMISKDVMLVQGNITLESDREKIISKTVERFNAINILINNAGIVGKNSFLKETEDEFNRVITNNLTGPIFLAQSIAKRMISNAFTGVIVNICSIAAYSPSTGSASYCSAKAGLLAATKNMALKLGPYGIRVNSISPGGIETDMSRHVWNDPERGPVLAETLPLKRSGQPEEIVGAVMYLCSNKASYTTGADIIIDGGWMLK